MQVAEGFTEIRWNEVWKLEFVIQMSSRAIDPNLRKFRTKEKKKVEN